MFPPPQQPCCSPFSCQAWPTTWAFLHFIPVVMYIEKRICRNQLWVFWEEATVKTVNAGQHSPQGISVFLTFMFEPCPIGWMGYVSVWHLLIVWRTYKFLPTWLKKSVSAQRANPSDQPVTRANLLNCWHFNNPHLWQIFSYYIKYVLYLHLCICMYILCLITINGTMKLNVLEIFWIMQ